MKKIILLSFILLLTVGCQSKAEKRVVWVSQCQTTGFSMEQCWLLLSMKERNDYIANDTAFATGMSGLAVGLSIGANAGRR